MPDEQGRLFAAECAEQVGIRPSDWRARASRGYAPAAVDHVAIPGGGMRAVWDPQQFAEYLTARQQRLAERLDFLKHPNDADADETGAPTDAL